MKAQNTRVYGGGGWFWVQYAGLTGLSPLVDGLKTQGISYQTPSGSIGIGGGGGGYLGRLHLGGEGGAHLGDKVGGGMGWFRLGYFFPLKGGFLVMPVGMIGGGGLSVQIRENAAPVAFTQIGTASVPMQEMRTGGMIVGGAAEIQKNLGGLLVGLSVGYLAGPSWKDWETDSGIKVSGAPKVSIGLPYVRLQIGGGGWSSPEKQ